jgi:hypothetical protein
MGWRQGLAVDQSGRHDLIDVTIPPHDPIRRHHIMDPVDVDGVVVNVPVDDGWVEPGDPGDVGG